MTQFKIKKEEFAEFLRKCMFIGTIQFRKGKAIRRPMFSCFYLDVDTFVVEVEDEQGNKKDETIGQLEVLAIDTGRKKVKLNVIKTGVEVIETGVITIQDPIIILNILEGKGMGKDAMISVRTDGVKMFIESETDGYEIKQRNNSDIKTLQDANLITKLTTWKSTHFENDEGILTFTAIDPKTNEEVIVSFDTKLEIDKKDLLKVVDDTINLTKDNESKIVMQDSIIHILKGEANANVKSMHNIPFKDLGTAVLNFSNDFFSMQTIIPNLYDKIVFNIRKIAANNSIALQIVSEDAKSNMKVIVAIASII